MSCVKDAFAESIILRLPEAFSIMALLFSISLLILSFHTIPKTHLSTMLTMGATRNPAEAAQAASTASR